jgi:hypothetical protein
MRAVATQSKLSRTTTATLRRNATNRQTHTVVFSVSFQCRISSRQHIAVRASYTFSAHG